MIDLQMSPSIIKLLNLKLEIEEKLTLSNNLLIAFNKDAIELCKNLELIDCFYKYMNEEKEVVMYIDYFLNHTVLKNSTIVVLVIVCRIFDHNDSWKSIEKSFKDFPFQKIKLFLTQYSENESLIEKLIEHELSFDCDNHKGEMESILFEGKEISKVSCFFSSQNHLGLDLKDFNRRISRNIKTQWDSIKLEYKKIRLAGYPLLRIRNDILSHNASNISFFDFNLANNLLNEEGMNFIRFIKDVDKFLDDLLGFFAFTSQVRNPIHAGFDIKTAIKCVINEAKLRNNLLNSSLVDFNIHCDSFGNL